MSSITQKLVAGAILGIAASSAIGLQASAEETAAQGVTVAGAVMYAGPNPNYPQVMHLAADLQVGIHGCVSSWQWCDISWRGKRGWVAASALEYRDKGESMPVAANTPIPTATFELSNYWAANYRHRLWYNDRAKWRALEGRGAQAADASAHSPSR
jgi:uncharacterized protein YraI